MNQKNQAPIPYRNECLCEIQFLSNLVGACFFPSEALLFPYSSVNNGFPVSALTKVTVVYLGVSIRSST